MGHPKALLDKVAALVAEEYPRDAGYEFIFEAMLHCTGPRRMFPDILVTREGQWVCAVEIGYTRPEKLTAYRHELHIPDVRWYDKQGCLHADVTEKVVSVRVEVESAVPGEVSVWNLWDEVPCIDCPEVGAIRRVPDRACERFARRFGDFALRVRNERPDEDMEEIEHYDVNTLVVTDHVRIWLPSYCDKCGRNWMAEGSGEGGMLMWKFEGTPREIGRRMGAQTLMSWDEACAEVMDTFELSLKVLDGYFIEAEDEYKVRREVHAGVFAQIDQARTPE